MDQRKLYKMIDSIASQKYGTEDEMLIAVLNEIVEHQNINVSGGRIWALVKDDSAYKLLYQTGSVEKINTDFELKIDEYPIFEYVAKERTILASETNTVLRSKGIFKYSASGVGDKIKINGKSFFEFLLALNIAEVDEEQYFTLNIIATALTSQIKQRRYSASAYHLKADIDKARELQKSILPEHEFRFSNFELFGITNPAEIVGGDFFDYMEIGDDSDRIAVIVGDAASKGVSAAAEAMYISGAMRMACNFEIKISPLMKRMNQLVNKIFADDKFASLFYGELSTDKGGLFLYANAGHNPPIFVKANSGEVTLLNPTGPVLGPAPGATYNVDNINFSLGDVLLIYSDGLAEATNNDYDEFGEQRLITTLTKSKHLSSRDIAYTILDEVIKYSKNGLYNDDKTLVVIKRIK
ncbi:MAG: serine/threonine-protein phosphatase [Ignavibacteriales bacterium]|nr:MAG: serine/threonine-protein phosphatase [Ignavibacteriales bacterium]